MNQRLVVVKQRMRKASKSLWSGLGLLKYLLIGILLTVVALISSLVVWSRVRPLADYRPSIEALLKKKLHANELSIKEVAWAWEWTTLSIGIQAKDVEYKDFAREVEGSIPEIRAMWNPLKLVVGTISLTFETKGSAWQLGVSEGTPYNASHSTSLLSHVKQPNFFEKLVDMHFVGSKLSISVPSAKQGPLLFKDVDLEFSMLGMRSHFDGLLKAKLLKSSSLGELHGDLDVSWEGAFQYVDKTLVGINVDETTIDFSHSEINGWGLFKKKSDPLRATFGVHVLVNDEGDFSTIDVKDGKLKFSDLSFTFDGDQKNASGAAFKWILENQQLNKNRLPFQVLHQARASGPIQAEGRISINKGWDLSAIWTLRANGINFKAVDLKEQFDARSEGSIVFNLAFDGGFENGVLHSSGFQLKIDAKDALLHTADKTIKKPAGQAAQVQVLLDVQNDLLTLKPSFFEWANFRSDVTGRIEGLSNYLFREAEAPFSAEIHSGRVDISKVAPILSFLTQNPVPTGILEFSGAVSGSLGTKSLQQQLEDRELAWRVDQFSLAGFEAGIDSAAWFDRKQEGYSLDGVIRADVSLRARGRGYLVQTSSLQTTTDITDAEFVWADQFRKLKGVPGTIRLGLSSVPNRIDVKASRISFLDNDIDFSGVLNQGSRSKIALSLRRPIDLSKWRAFFRAREDISLQGQLQPSLYLSLLTSPEQMDGGIDWRRVGMAGLVKFQNLRGVHGALAMFDQSSGSVNIADGKIYLQNIGTKLGGQKYIVSGSINPYAQRGAISFYDIASAKKWNVDLSVSGDQVELATLLKSLYPDLNRTDLARAKNSLEPKTWFEPQEVDAFAKWPLLENVQIKTKWNIKTLKVGPWTLDAVKAGASNDKGQIKYVVDSAKWKQAQLSGAGVWELKPKSNATHGLPLNGTWLWRNAPLGELLALWDLRESKVFKGNFTGSLVYAVEKSTRAGIEDLNHINLDGKLTDADHTVMKVLKEGVSKVLQDLGVAQKCFADKWQGTFKAWSSGDGTLRVDEANWSSVPASAQTSVKWSIRADQSERAAVVGQWIPSRECLGPQVSACWKTVNHGDGDGDVGRFVLSGAWDKLSLSWTQGVWANVRECLRPTKGAAEVVKEQAGDAKDTETLKNYLKKNAN